MAHYKSTPKKWAASSLRKHSNPTEKAQEILNISREIKNEGVPIKKELGNMGTNSGQINFFGIAIYISLNSTADVYILPSKIC